MGCRNSTREPQASSSEEELIQMHELDLGLHMFDSAHNETCIRREAYQGSLTDMQLARLAKSLDLDLRPLKDDTTPVAKFFAKIKANVGYDPDKLVILGILLGNSSSQLKLGLLSQHADYDAKDEIDEPDLYQLLEDISFLSGRCLPLLALQNDLDDQIYKYMDKLKHSIHDLVVMQTSYILRGRSSIPTSEFRSLLESPEHSFWLKPDQVRRKLLGASKGVPRSSSTDSFKAFEDRFCVQKTVEA